MEANELQAFFDIMDHEIEWGARSVDRFGSQYKEYYLSLGLTFLHKVTEAKTYEERFRVLHPKLYKNEKSFQILLSN